MRGDPDAPITHRRVLRLPVPALQAPAQPALERMLDEYRGQVKLYFKHYPIDARAPRCAGRGAGGASPPASRASSGSSTTRSVRRRPGERGPADPRALRQGAQARHQELEEGHGRRRRQGEPRTAPTARRSTSTPPRRCSSTARKYHGPHDLRRDQRLDRRGAQQMKQARSVVFVAVLRRAPRSPASAKGSTRPTSRCRRSTAQRSRSRRSRARSCCIDFWAQWCEPCKKELPAAAEARQGLRRQGRGVIAVNIDKQRDNAAAPGQAARPVSFDVLLDPAGSVAGTYDLPKMPTSFVIDKKGDRPLRERRLRRAAGRRALQAGARRADQVACRFRPASRARAATAGSTF